MGRNSDSIVTYEPNNAIKKGVYSLVREIIREVADNRWLLIQLFKRDFLSMYKQSFAGVAWAGIIPFLSIATFLVLQRSGVLSVGTMAVPYPLYAVFGMMFWQVFAVGIQNGANALVKAGSMIVKINFSRKSLVIAAGGQALVTFLIQFVILGLVYFYYGITPHPTILLVPVLVIPLFLFTLGLSFLLSILNGIMRDIGAMLSFFLTFVMFLTPVLYVKPSAGVLSVMSRYNPLFYLISVPRDFVLYGRTGDWGGFAIAGLAGVLVFFACLIVFHLTETRITERV